VVDGDVRIDADTCLQGAFVGVEAGVVVWWEAASAFQRGKGEQQPGGRTPATNSARPGKGRGLCNPQ